MGIFSRFNDIINANINALLDRAEDPEKIIRLVIQEMEDTLVEVRSNAARTIAEHKTLQRRLQRLRREAAEWERKAELAVRKGREDLARAALAEKALVERAVAAMADDLEEVDHQLAKLNDDIARLQEKLADARARQKTLALRHQAASTRLKARDTLGDRRIDEALSRFEHLEQKMDTLEGRVEAHDLGGPRGIEQEFAELETEDQIERELERLRARARGAEGRDGQESDEA